MRLRLICTGRMKKGPERELCDTYLKRARASGPQVGLSGFSILELPESRADSAAARKAEEAARLNDRLSSGAFLLLLDERGRDLSSRELAGLLAREAEAGRAACDIIIGGPDGLDASLLERADAVIRLGRLTWPHQLVRVMLAEQLYRTVTILQGHPYHRD